MSVDESSPGTTDASGTYQLMAGTSMSTPMVAGTVALILEKNPTLRQEQIRLGLQATARKDAQTGTGSAVPNEGSSSGAGTVCTLPTSPDGKRDHRDYRHSPFERRHEAAVSGLRLFHVVNCHDVSFPLGSRTRTGAIGCRMVALKMRWAARPLRSSRIGAAPLSQVTFSERHVSSATPICPAAVQS